jgi:hypothetical protein
LIGIIKNLINLPAAKIHSGDGSCVNNNQGEAILGCFNTSDHGAINVPKPINTIVDDSPGIESLFQSVDVTAFQDIFSDDATMKWMTVASIEEDLSILSKTETTVSDDDGVYLNGYDENELGEFLLDVLTCP